MIEAGVPVVPGGEGLLESLEQAKRSAKEIGYPVILKATAGGGGKGMRVFGKKMKWKKLGKCAKQKRLHLLKMMASTWKNLWKNHGI